MGVERWSKVRKPLQIMKVEMIPLSEVRSHEEVIEEELEDFTRSLKSKGVFYRPILLDKNTLVVLDGHHRVEGLRRLGAKKVPSILLDYDSDDIKLYTWYPIIWEDRDEVMPFLEKYAKLEEMGVEDAQRKVDANEALFCILPGIDGRTTVIYSEEDLMDDLGKHFGIEYVDTLDFLTKMENREGVLLYRRAHTKEEVIERALKGNKFPPKTTRHYLPYRYQDIRIKLSYLF